MATQQRVSNRTIGIHVSESRVKVIMGELVASKSSHPVLGDRTLMAGLGLGS